MAERSRTLLAICMVLFALLCFDCMGILVRVLIGRGYTPPELAAYRNIFGVIPPLAVMLWFGELQFRREALLVKRWKLALFRGLMVAIAQISFFTALGLLELATISALAQTNAMFVVLISVILLGERVGPWRIFALVVGFVGVIWILRPGSDAFSLAAVLPIVAAFCYGFSVVSVRFFESHVSNALLFLYSTFASAVATTAVALFTTGISPFATLLDAVMIITLGLAGGVLIIMLAYRMAPPSQLAPFSYFGILSAFFFGWLFFDEAPVDTLFPGVILIVGAGVLIIWRERFARTDPKTSET